MKQLLFFTLLFMVVGCSCGQRIIHKPGQYPHEAVTLNGNSDTTSPFAKILFDSATYHFGEIRKGEKLYREIFFTNSGPGDLLIELISACECTTLDWSRLPIKPGNKSKIKVTYDSKDKEGPQIVDIEVTANTNPPISYAKFKLYVSP